MCRFGTGTAADETYFDNTCFQINFAGPCCYPSNNCCGVLPQILAVGAGYGVGDELGSLCLGPFRPSKGLRRARRGDYAARYCGSVNSGALHAKTLFHCDSSCDHLIDRGRCARPADCAGRRSGRGCSGSGGDSSASGDNAACGQAGGSHDGETRRAQERGGGAKEKEDCSEEDDQAAGDRQIDRQRDGALTLSQPGSEAVPPPYSVRQAIARSADVHRARVR
jgi:hypothetical protein